HGSCRVFLQAGEERPPLRVDGLRLLQELRVKLLDERRIAAPQEGGLLELTVDVALRHFVLTALTAFGPSISSSGFARVWRVTRPRRFPPAAWLRSSIPHRPFPRR